MQLTSDQQDQLRQRLFGIIVQDEKTQVPQQFQWMIPSDSADHLSRQLTAAAVDELSKMNAPAPAKASDDETTIKADGKKSK